MRNGNEIDKELADKYQRSQVLLNAVFTKDYLLNTTIYPNWIPDTDFFWYERAIRDESGVVRMEYRLVDARAAHNTIAFDHEVLANALAEVTNQSIDATQLPISHVQIDLDPVTVRFAAFDKYWQFCSDTNSCVEKEREPEAKTVSPDGCYVAFTRDDNLWIRDRANGKERPLTNDGETLFAYAVTGDGWGEPVDSGIQIRWSPDSKRILTVQRSMHGVKKLPVMHYVPFDGNIRPQLEYFNIAFPGDKCIPEYRVVSIDVETGEHCEAEYRRIPVCRNGWGFFNANLGWWANDSRRAYFIEQERGDKIVRLVEFNTDTGCTNILFEERSETQINISPDSEMYPLFVVIEETNELIWWSERSGWAHLYLYNLDNGELKNAITQGDWQVRDLLYYDNRRREVFVQTAGREQGKDPYYKDLARINIDNGKIVTFISSDHEITAAYQKDLNTRGEASFFGYCIDGINAISPSGKYAVVTRSRADELPCHLLLNRGGQELLEIESVDISVLNVSLKNWKWPEPVKLLAADGKTDIYGLVCRPSDFSEDKSYPVVSHVFNIVDYQWVPKGSFTNGPNAGYVYLDAMSLAELGFIVVLIDGRGTPFRNKTFLDESYGWLADASILDDHVAGIQQLAAKYPYMDLNRVGIISPGGGPGGLEGLLKFPDFYKVGVAQTPHDSRLMSASMMGDKYEGISGPTDDRKYPEDLVENLKGKLLLTQGMLDNCTPASGTFRIVEALQKANKDFDMLFLPKLGHAPSSYLSRRGRDYLVKHLLNIEPPKEYKLKLPIG